MSWNTVALNSMVRPIAVDGWKILMSFFEDAAFELDSKNDVRIFRPSTGFCQLKEDILAINIHKINNHKINLGNTIYSKYIIAKKCKKINFKLYD